MIKKISITSMAILITLSLTTNCHALSKSTHLEVNSYILKNTTSLNSTLKHYNIPEGTDKRYKAINPATKKEENLRIFDIIANGGESEDDPLRYGNHYHNPLQGWDSSGYKGFDKGITPLDVLIKAICYSDPVWAQKKNQGVPVLMEGNHSWPDAREYFYKALTASNDDAKQPCWAALFLP